MDDNNFFMINFHQGDHCLMTQRIGFNVDNPTAFYQLAPDFWCAFHQKGSQQ
jgi:hypothetical protein